MLDLDRITCVRGNRPLFADLTLSLQPGECMHVRGDNGTGKTSLLRTVCGLAQPESGRVLWQGQPIDQAQGFHDDLLYLGHALALKDDLTAVENLSMQAGIAGTTLAPAAAMQALTQLGLRAGHHHLPARLLSQGQRRRVALARLLVTRARLWVLDEPVVALDAAAQQAFGKAVETHAAQGGMTLLTSHQSLPLGGLTCREIHL